MFEAPRQTVICMAVSAKDARNPSNTAAQNPESSQPQAGEPA